MRLDRAHPGARPLLLRRRRRPRLGSHRCSWEGLGESELAVLV